MKVSMIDNASYYQRGVLVVNAPGPVRLAEGRRPVTALGDELGDGLEPALIGRVKGVKVDGIKIEHSNDRLATG